MDKIANAMRTGEAPLGLHHDETRRLDAKLTKIEVRDTDEGYRGVWVEMEVDEDELRREGVGGFSIAAVESLKLTIADEKKPFIAIYADPAHFDEASILGAASQLERDFSVHAGRIYQFSVVPPAKVAIEMALTVLQQVPPNLITAALYDALKTWFMRPKKAARTIFSFRFKHEHGHVHAQLETDDPAVAKEALRTRRDIALASQAGDGYEFDATTSEWKKYR